MKLRWDDLALFLAVYEQGSLSGAARLLKLGQPTLSRRIAELESTVGEALLLRQSQGISLTAAGQKLLPAAQRMAEWANEAELSITQQTTHQPEGNVRIAAPPSIAYEVLAPMAAKIRQAYPHIQITALSGLDTLNLARGEADLSLRTRKPTDADLMCVDEVTSAMRVYCSKAYAAQFKTPPARADLNWIGWAASLDNPCSIGESNQLAQIAKPAFTSDDYLVQMAACKAGVGAMLLPQILHRQSGLGELHELVELDVDLGETVMVSLYLVCHKRHRYLPKVQLVMDFIGREFESLRLENLSDNSG
ncbi:MAG: LysR family transcriptional regulator [Methylococcaceae bacterium]|nr:LysR family transcriptional regulator [Methylococcaceae bacterium]